MKLKPSVTTTFLRPFPSESTTPEISLPNRESENVRNNTMPRNLFMTVSIIINYNPD